MVREKEGGAGVTSDGNKSEGCKANMACFRGAVTSGETCEPYIQGPNVGTNKTMRHNDKLLSKKAATTPG